MTKQKGLVSFTLFGDKRVYNVGALRNVDIWNSSEFDVDCRFYVGHSVPKIVVAALENKGAEVRVVDRPEDQTATFWRFDALQKCNYDYILFRDVDSRPFEREFHCIRGWLREGLPNHVIRDHPYHGVPILAGLFGVKKEEFQNIGRQLPSVIPDDYYQMVNRVQNAEHFMSNDFYQIDQWWLRLRVYPYMHNLVTAHDDFFSFERFRFKMALPERTPDLAFCGEGFDEFENPRYPTHRRLITGWPV